MSGSDLRSEGRQKIGAMAAIVLPVLFLSGLGIVSLISAGAAHTDTMVFVKKQAVWLGIAIFAGCCSSLISLDFLRKFVWPVALISLVLLVLVLIPGIGKDVNGARRWIAIGSFAFQASDFAKFALILTMSAYLHNNQRVMRTLKYGTILPSAIIAIFCGLMALEPDFGTTALCGVVAFTLLFMAGSRISFVAPFAIIGALGVGVMIYFNPNRVARLASFLYPEENASGGAYQLMQAIYAFGAGGVEGAGLGQGRQQYAFLPEAHTDFIFANIGEELGLWGTLSVLSIFVFLLAVFTHYLRKAPNLYEFSMGFGAMLMIVVQAVFNMGVVTGIFPTKGISLPFISYGGSNLVVMFFFCGIMVNCVRRWTAPKQIKAKEYE